MEKSEPALVPEWLRSCSPSGSLAAGGSSAHHFASSSVSDGSLLANSARSRFSKSTSDFDSPLSSFLDRSTSSNSRRNSTSNGSAKNAYSSFSSSRHRDRERDREKERLASGDHWDRDSFDPLGNILSGRGEKETLRRSYSLVSRKQGEVFPRRVANDLRNGANSHHNGNGANIHHNGNGTDDHHNGNYSNKHHNGNGVLSGGNISNSSHKATFEKDFPSLGSEQKQGMLDSKGKTLSPGLNTVIPNLHTGTSAIFSGEGWSALAEAPVVVGSSSMGSSIQQTPFANLSSVAASTTSCLNMAEALVQAPQRTQNSPQLSVETHKLEALASIKSRQLIPMTPSMPKPLVVNSSDMLKPKTATRTGEAAGATKGVQQQPSSPHLRGRPARSDSSSHAGKFYVLKPARENGCAPPKDVASPINSDCIKVPTSHHSAALSGSFTRTPNPGPTIEKRPVSHAQSRNDFFNLMRKKTLASPSAILPDSSTEKCGEEIKEAEAASLSCSHDGREKDGKVTGNGEQTLSNLEEKSFNAVPDEEEFAFLKSLGWDGDKNSEEDEGLTEEEINSFYQEVRKLRPSLKMCRGMQPKLLMPPGDASSKPS